MPKTRKDERLKKTKFRRNYLPSLIVTIILWLLLIFVIYFIDPHTFGAIFLFFIVVFFAFLFTASIIFTNTRRGFLTTLGLVLFLFLRLIGIGHVLNLLLIAAIIATVEFYFSRN